MIIFRVLYGCYMGSMALCLSILSFLLACYSMLFRSTVSMIYYLSFISFSRLISSTVFCIISVRFSSIDLMYTVVVFFLVGAVPFFFLLRQTPFRIIIVMCVFVWCKSYCYVRTFEERKKHEVCFRIIEWIQMLVFGHNLAQCIMSTQCQIAYSILKIRGGKKQILDRQHPFQWNISMVEFPWKSYKLLANCLQYWYGYVLFIYSSFYIQIQLLRKWATVQLVGTKYHTKMKIENHLKAIRLPFQCVNRLRFPTIF